MEEVFNENEDFRKSIYILKQQRSILSENTIKCRMSPIVNKSKNKLFLGDISDSHNFEMLEEMEIKTIITLSSDFKTKYVIDNYEKLEIEHHQHIIEDIPEAKIYELLDFVNYEITKGLEKGNVLIHCYAGMSRSATCVLYFLLREGLFDTLNETLRYLINARSIVCPNIGFIIQLFLMYKMKEDPSKYRHILDSLYGDGLL